MKIKRIGNLEFIWSELNNQYEIIRHCGENINIAIAFIEYGRDKRDYPDLRTVGDRPYDSEINWEDFGVLSKFALDYANLMGVIDAYIADNEFHNARY
jgi:hypothetical protein